MTGSYSYLTYYLCKMVI